MAPNVFTFWNQKISDAPLVVRLGIESWRRACEHEGIKLTVVNSENCIDFEAKFPAQTRRSLQFVRKQIEQKKSYHSWRTYSNVLRLALITHTGGIWADPTSVCTKPISTWCQTPPFGFKFPRFEGIHQTSENWLLVSEKDNEICLAWLDHLANYYVKNPNLHLPSRGKTQSSWSTILIKCTHFHPRFGWLWFHWFTTKIIRITNYFTAYFSFEVVRRESFPNHPVHYFHLDIDSSIYRAFITSDWNDFDTHWCRDRVLALPVIKLSWKRDKATRLTSLPRTHAFQVIADRIGVTDADLQSLS